MYFEGGSAAWALQDTCDSDSENTGTMIGAWIALKDIAANAHRFFACSK